MMGSRIGAMRAAMAMHLEAEDAVPHGEANDAAAEAHGAHTYGGAPPPQTTNLNTFGVVATPLPEVAVPPIAAHDAFRIQGHVIRG